MKPKVLDNAVDLFNECITFTNINTIKKKMAYIQKTKKVFYYENLRLTDDYQYASEEEEEKGEKEQQTSKKEPLKKPTKDDVNNLNEWVNEKERGIGSEIIQRHFKFQKPSNMLKSL